jgi:large subunit ribosomal protein L17
MLHKTFGWKLNRDVKERKALFRSLIIALIQHGRIETSVAKAKAVTRMVDKLVTKAKDNTDASIRKLSSFLTQKAVISRMRKVIAPKFLNRHGGYVRVRKTSLRSGDGTQKVIIEWTENMEETEEKSKAKKNDKKTTKKAVKKEMKEKK